MVNKERQEVLDRRDAWSPDCLDGLSLEQAVQEMSILRYQYEREECLFGYRTKLVAENYGYDGGCDWYVEVYRPETDLEYHNRLQHEEKLEKDRRLKADIARFKKKQKAEAELARIQAEERAEYERLHAIYGAVAPKE